MRPDLVEGTDHRLEQSLLRRNDFLAHRIGLRIQRAFHLGPAHE